MCLIEDKVVIPREKVPGHHLALQGMLTACKCYLKLTAIKTSWKWKPVSNMMAKAV